MKQYLEVKKISDSTIYAVFEAKSQIIDTEYSSAIDIFIKEGTAKQLYDGIPLEIGNNKFQCIYQKNLPEYLEGIVLNFWYTGKTLIKLIHGIN